ncbi:MAG: HAD family hydrolase [Desulfobacterales bacterium]|nr:HAD family hydrolase [Desulfobacterales bacterium]
MKKNTLLASDMDGTVIPLDDQPKRASEIERFTRLLQRHENVGLAYVTGRHLQLALAGVERYRLPRPDILVCDVGTSIYFYRENRWQPDQGFRAELKKSWHGLTGRDIGRLLVDIPLLTVQEPERQKEFKQSYYLARTEEQRRVIDGIRERLAESGVKANIIYSVDSGKNIGLVDVLPESAAKDYALGYLRQVLGLARERVVYAGDSGNDLPAFVSGFNAIVVNNTAEPVKAEARRLARQKGIEARIFFASADFVNGVMEGCFHFQLFTEQGE